MGLRHDLYLARKPLMGFVAIGAAWSVYFAQMPVIKAQVGASDGAYGIAFLFASIGALAAMWMAPLSRRLAGGYAMPLAILGVGLGMMGAGISANIAVLVFAMLLASMGSGVIDVLVNARVSEVEEDTGRTLMSLTHAVYSFAYAGAALVTGALRTAALSPAIIMAMMLCVLVVLAVLSFDKPPQVVEAQTTGANQMPLFVVILAGVVLCAAIFAESATEGWSALHLERTLGGSPAEGALGPALLGLAMGIGRMMGHVAVKYIKDTTLMIAATLVAAFGVVLAGVAPNVSLALAGFAVAGFGISVVFPLAIALVGRVVAPQARMAAISRASVIGSSAFIFGPPLMGLVSEGAGLRAAFYMVAGILAMVALILIPMLAARAVRR